MTELATIGITFLALTIKVLIAAALYRWAQLIIAND